LREIERDGERHRERALSGTLLRYDFSLIERDTERDRERELSGMLLWHHIQ